MVKVFNIHGFRGSWKNSAYNAIPSNIRITSPDFDYEKLGPKLMLEQMKSVIPDGVKYIIGTSLGGFYATVLGNMLDIPTILINPCLTPHKIIPKLEPSMESFNTEFLELYKKWVCGADYSKTSIIIGSDDELINHEEITASLETWCKKYVRVKAGHQISTEILGGSLCEFMKATE